MDPKPLLFPFLYDVQEADELMSESTSIYDAPLLRDRLKEESGKSVASQEPNETITQNAKRQNGKVRTIALKNRQLVQGVVLRNEIAKLLVETKDGPLWIAKSQIVEIYD